MRVATPASIALFWQRAIAKQRLNAAILPYPGSANPSGNKSPSATDLHKNQKSDAL